VYTDRLDLPSIELPANASRFFDSPDEALAQPTGRVRLAWDSVDPYLYNDAFDESLVAYDDSYCTTVVDIEQRTQVPTSNYIFEQVMPFLDSPNVIDIGCGQGEFVSVLRARAIRAVGFDPVLRAPTHSLNKRNWSSGEEAADLYVMRCVLPHIPSPWGFLDTIGESAPDALILIEFQRIEWILDQDVWFQISHDHVNLFSIDDFLARYDVPAWGTFSNGEWGWVLIQASSRRVAELADCSYLERLSDLYDYRAAILHRAAGREAVVWGAAGKGIVLVHALVSAGADVPMAIDADLNRWERYLDVSGVRVSSPLEALAHLNPKIPVLVANPNHFHAIAEKYGDQLDIRLPGDL
jgi:Methyltransferase domain